MSLWDVMVSIIWFMLLVAWFWLLISIISDVFRDDDLSGVAKGAWCLFVIVLPWLGVLVYLIARGHSMTERSAREAARHQEAFRTYVKEVAVAEGDGLAGQIRQLAEMRDRGTITPEEFDKAKQRLLGTSGSTPVVPQQHVPVEDNLPA
jgi:hypothetical protein